MTFVDLAYIQLSSSIKQMAHRLKHLLGVVAVSAVVHSIPERLVTSSIQQTYQTALQEVQKHSRHYDCWVIVRRKIYDVSDLVVTLAGTIAAKSNSNPYLLEDFCGRHVLPDTEFLQALQTLSIGEEKEARLAGRKMVVGEIILHPLLAQGCNVHAKHNSVHTLGRSKNVFKGYLRRYSRMPREPTSRDSRAQKSAQNKRIIGYTAAEALQEVALHTREDDCWVIVDMREIYDLSGFFLATNILTLCGTRVFSSTEKEQLHDPLARAGLLSQYPDLVAVNILEKLRFSKTSASVRLLVEELADLKILNSDVNKRIKGDSIVIGEIISSHNSSLGVAGSSSVIIEEVVQVNTIVAKKSERRFGAELLQFTTQQIASAITHYDWANHIEAAYTKRRQYCEGPEKRNKLGCCKKGIDRIVQKEMEVEDALDFVRKKTRGQISAIEVLHHAKELSLRIHQTSSANTSREVSTVRYDQLQKTTVNLIRSALEAAEAQEDVCGFWFAKRAPPRMKSALLRGALDMLLWRSGWWNPAFSADLWTVKRGDIVVEAPRRKDPDFVAKLDMLKTGKPEQKGKVIGLMNSRNLAVLKICIEWAISRRVTCDDAKGAKAVPLWGRETVARQRVTGTGWSVASSIMRHASSIMGHDALFEPFWVYSL